MFLISVTFVVPSCSVTSLIN